MKKNLISLALGALLLIVPRGAKADVSVDFFYNNLSGGSWIEVADYGYCWQPDLAVGNSTWRPYSDGYWAYTDLGWTWVSYEDFGWATYHYGRWALLSDYGWVWVPGRDADLEWGPAWVSWRTGGEYIGWAPLPPETMTVVEGRPLTGHLDVEFNIGPAYYNFVDVRYIGEPVLRERIIPTTQNITYVQQTVNVTNITYKNQTIYNYGPDINVVNRVSTRPVQRLRLDRQQNVDVATAAKTGGLTKVQGDRLMVAAPARITRSARQVAPPAVKTKVEAAKIDRGWSGVGDERAQAELKEKIKSQNLKSVPPPTGRTAAGQANTAAEASPAAAGAGAAAEAGAQGDQGRGPGRQGQRAAQQGMANATPGSSASPAQGGAADIKGQRGQGRRTNRFPEATEQNAQTPGAAAGQMRGAPTPGAESNAANTPGTGTAGEQSQGAGDQGRQGRRPQMQGESAEGAAGQPAGGQGQGRQGRRLQNQPGETAPGEQQGQGGGQGRQGRRMQNQPAETTPGEAQGQGGPRRQHERGQGASQEQQGQGQGQDQGQGQQGRRKGQPQPSPAASPQG